MKTENVIVVWSTFKAFLMVFFVWQGHYYITAERFDNNFEAD